MSSFRIFGRVLNDYSRRGIPGLRVEVWDKHVKDDHLCGTAVTDYRGAYQVEFDESAYTDAPKDILPDVYLKVFSGEKLIKSTEDNLRRNLPAGDTEILLEVELSKPRVAP